MKLTFAAEDTIVGIVCGLLLIGFTGKFFNLKLSPILYVLAFLVYVFFILLDLVNEIKDLTTHFGFIVFSILHSLADLAIALTMIAYFSKWTIPYISSILLHLVKNETAIFYLGAFLIVGNTIWLIMYPFLD